MNRPTATFHFPLLAILGLIFVTLKLTGYIAWSWWWVLAPFWVGFAIAAVVLIAALLFVALVSMWGR